MNRLNELQAEVGLMHRSGKVASDAVMAELFALLRAAASETVGTEWTTRYTEAQARGADAHNADLAAARLAVANAKAERDAAINLAYQYPPSEPYNPDGVTWRQMYEMLDEKSLGDKHGHDCAVAALTEQRDAALARVAELEAKQPQPSAEAKADEALRLVARLADIVKLLTEDHGSGLMVAEIDAIIADARRGCGA